MENTWIILELNFCRDMKSKSTSRYSETVSVLVSDDTFKFLANYGTPASSPEEQESYRYKTAENTGIMALDSQSREI